MSEHKEKGFIDKLNSQEAFKAGLASGVGAIFVIGFFILLGLFVNGDGISLGNNSNKNNNFEDKQVAIVDEETGIKVVQPHSGDWVQGNPDAKITLIEYSDIDCPFCSRFHETGQQVVDAYPEEVNWVYRHFPLPQLHPDAAKKAEATECVGELGGNDAFWTYIDKLFVEKTAMTELAKAAGQVGVDQAKFQECLDSGKYASKLAGTTKEATEAGGRGTPYSILTDGKTSIPINGALPFEQIKAQIDTLLAK